MDNLVGNTRFLSILLIIVLCLIVYFFIRKRIKVLNVPNVFLISGAVKTGKTLLSVHLAKKEYRRNLRNWYIKKFFLRAFKRPIPKRPMLYTNIPLARVKYNLLSMNIILQKKAYS